LSAVVQLKPDAQAYGDLAFAIQMQGRAREALTLYRRALALNPDFTPALNNLAWLLATLPNPALRDGAEAVRLAEQACGMGPARQASLISTLAAAYAEAGRFDDAIRTAREAVELAEAAGGRGLVERNSRLLESYQAHRPWREPAGGGAAPAK
jgi:protein O-mannosyl-transferase